MQRAKPQLDRGRLSTGIEGLDGLLKGGFPQGSMVLVSGRPGTGKTLLASQFLYEGAVRGEPSLYISFVETKDQFLVNMDKFGLDFRKLAEKGTFSFVDLSTVAPEGVSDALELIVEQVESIKGRRLVIDSFTALAQAFEKVIDARTVLHVVLGKLVHDLGCTTVVLAEMPYGADRIGLGMEEFVADGIIVMDVASSKGIPRRTLMIRKMRGTEITLRPSSYEITKNGIAVFPATLPVSHGSMSSRRVPTGIPGFDELVEGGLPSRSIVGIAGAAGTGKTTFGMQFVYNGAKAFGERGLILSFNESADQIRLVLHKLGMNTLGELERSKKIRIDSIVPEQFTPEGVILHLRRVLDENKPKRVVLDDVTGLEDIMTEEEFPRVLSTMARMAQERGATVIVVLTTDEMAGTAITGRSLSTTLDGIIMLRYVEVEGTMDRSMIVLKMRGTRHNTSIRRFTIAKGGLTVGEPFAGYSGLLTGEARRMISTFQEEARIKSEQKKAGDGRKKSLAKRLARQTVSKRSDGPAGGNPRQQAKKKNNNKAQPAKGKPV